MNARREVLRHVKQAVEALNQDPGMEDSIEKWALAAVLAAMSGDQAYARQALMTASTKMDDPDIDDDDIPDPGSDDTPASAASLIADQI